MSFDFKAATPDTPIPDDNAGIFGADSQTAITPSWYSFGTIKDYFRTGYGAPRNRFYAFSDMLNIRGIVSSEHFQSEVAGTGAIFTAVPVSSLNAIGIINFYLGTTTTGRCLYWSGQQSGLATQVKFGSGRARFACKAAIHTQSNGTDTYAARMGFIDANSSESTNGIFFRYTDGVNSGKWQAVCRAGGTETAVDTGIASTADAWHLFEIDVTADGSSVVFKVDGSLVATITTNIPSTSGYGILALKSAGTTGVSAVYLDYIEVEVLFTTTR